MHPAPYRNMRNIVLGMMGLFPLLWVVLLVAAPERADAGVIRTALPALLAVVSIPVVLALRRNLLRPFPHDISEAAARGRSRETLNIFIAFSMLIAVSPAMLGFAWALFDGNLVAYLVPFVVAETLLGQYVLPRRATLEAVRERFEADGARSYLWEAFTGGPRP